MLEVRAMTSDDISALEPLLASRNVHPREYERFLALEGAFGLLLFDGERLVGATSVMRYFEHGFLGPILLHPDAEGVGFSLALASHAMKGLQLAGVDVVDAEASASESIILENLGFRRQHRTLVLQREPASPAPSRSADTTTRAMTPADLLDVGAIDASAVGYGRKGYLLQLLRELPDGARVVERHGEVAGYSLMRRSRRGYHLGPLVTRAGRDDAGEALIDHALGLAAGHPLVALAPRATRETLDRSGFSEVGELYRMRAGQRAPPRDATEWLLGGRITG